MVEESVLLTKSLPNETLETLVVTIEAFDFDLRADGRDVEWADRLVPIDIPERILIPSLSSGGGGLNTRLRPTSGTRV